MATMFILLVLAYFVIRFDVSVIEKLVLATTVSAFALAPFVLPTINIAAAIGQGVIGIYIVLRMHYLRAAR
jgi:uncharacterized membrane protein